MELYSLGVFELKQMLDKKEISAAEIVSSVYGRIDAVEEKIKAYVTLTRDEAFEMARTADKERSEGRSGALLGIPIAIKDNMCTKGIKTTCSSKILRNFVPPYESSVTARLREDGYVLTGKDEPRRVCDGVLD